MKIGICDSGNNKGNIDGDFDYGDSDSDNIHSNSNECNRRSNISVKEI